MCSNQAQAICSYEIIEWSPANVPNAAMVEGAASSQFTSLWRYSGSLSNVSNSQPSTFIDLQLQLQANYYYGIFSSCVSNRWFQSGFLTVAYPAVFAASTSEISTGSVSVSSVTLNIGGYLVQPFPMQAFGGMIFTGINNIRYLSNVTSLPVWNAYQYYSSDWGEVFYNDGPFDFGFAEILAVFGCNATFPCNNNGTCTAGVCSCLSGFTGPLCDEGISFMFRYGRLKLVFLKPYVLLLVKMMAYVKMEFVIVSRGFIQVQPAILPIVCH